MSDFPLVYRWRNNEVRALLYGRRCRIVIRGSMNSCLLEFEDGEKVVTSRNAVRKVKEGE